MKTIGFVISRKSGEQRRAVLPCDIKNIKHPEMLVFEEGYATHLGVQDEEYLRLGCRISSRDEVLNCDVITDVKLGDADYISGLKPGKILFGWAHAVQNVPFTSEVIRGKHTLIAWEDIFEDGRYIFYRNREIAGEAAIMHAFRFSGKLPYDCKVAVIGNGQTAKGALRVLHGLGADVDVFPRKFESLFLKKKFEYDVIVNCVMWDTNRTDRLIYASDLKKMKPRTLIIDVSCDPYLEIETSHPTTISDPVYEVDGVIHYSVDNTPAMFPVSVTKVLSEGLSRYIDYIIEGQFDLFPESLADAVIIQNGIIKDVRIRQFREARGVFCD